jgi:hypothetical protein
MRHGLEPDAMNFATWAVPSRQPAVAALRAQSEFAVFKGIKVAAAAQDGAFDISPDGGVRLGDVALRDPALLPFHLRHALEAAWLIRHGVSAPLASLAAARAAALFAAADGLAVPPWAQPLQWESPPALASLATIRGLWTRLGTAESLMETGGDIRLARDPVSALNGYGSSHRPRPWAVTFASSTASSSSERGYVAADLARLRATAAMLTADARAAVAAALEDVRAALARFYALPDGSAVVLAASGTDTELLALALSHLAAPAPILNILVAPEETGSGVPMAARGLHFAVDTALGHDVARAAPIEGFRADTALAMVALRDPDGNIRHADIVDEEIAATVADGIAAGRRVILHVLDLSKTGLLAPGLACVKRLRARHGAAFDIVVDACQARLSPPSVREYLALDAVVLVTGSKFFTGPPFAGAALIPPAIAARLASCRLPAGLEAYFGRDDFPAGCPAAAALPPVGNYGLALRWHAALAEMAAFWSVPPARRANILTGFATIVADEIAANPALRLLAATPLARTGDDEAWERCRTIFTFALAAPHEPGRELTPDEARLVYHWLNADLSDLPGLSAADQNIASCICHIGQPVKLPAPGGGFIGVLRVSAGARLVSGEPSHQALNPRTRVAREFDDLRGVFAKLRLILIHFGALRKIDPQPRYR